MANLQNDEYDGIVISSILKKYNQPRAHRNRDFSSKYKKDLSEGKVHHGQVSGKMINPIKLNISPSTLQKINIKEN